MFVDVDNDVEVAGGPATHTCFAVARAAQARTVLDAGGDAHLQFGTMLHAAFAAATFAGIGDNLPGAIAPRAGGRDREKSA